MHLLWDQKAYQKCEVGGEKLLVYDAREDYRNIKQKECKHVELATAGAAPRAPPAPGAHGPASAHGCSSWGARGAREVGKGEGNPTRALGHTALSQFTHRRPGFGWRPRAHPWEPGDAAMAISLHPPLRNKNFNVISVSSRRVLLKA